MTDQEFQRALAAIVQQMKTEAEAEVRRRWREDHGLIYVREYTVRAHVYRRKVRPQPLAAVTPIAPVRGRFSARRAGGRSVTPGERTARQAARGTSPRRRAPSRLRP